MSIVCSQCKLRIKTPGNYCPSCGNKLISTTLKNGFACDGCIGYYGLSDWWFNSFSDKDRQTIENTYNPMGSNEDRPLTQGHISQSSRSKTQFLYSLASWFLKPGQRHIARIAITKAEEVSVQERNVLDTHFMYSTMVDVYYKDRENDPNALDKAIYACTQQIALSRQAAQQFKVEYPKDHLPSHKGFKQLIIIRKKQKEFEEAIRLMKKYMEEGWMGDYTSDIEKCEKKLRK
jgi:hypothetical protein